MLLNTDDKPSVENPRGVCGSLTLAVNLDELSIFSPLPLQTLHGVSAIKSVAPVGRNTFCILRFGTLFVVFDDYFSFQYLVLRNM